jgi:hypothetical protein
MSWWWPFSKSKHADESASQTEFEKQIAESKVRSNDLEAAADRLRTNRENVHKRAQQLLGEENVVAARQALKSTPG